MSAQGSPAVSPAVSPSASPSVTVRVPTILRPLTGGQKAVDGTGSTLGELLADLEQRHQGLSERVVQDGALRRFVNVYVNDEDVRFTGGLDTALGDGDAVIILPAVAGGARDR